MPNENAALTRRIRIEHRICNRIIKDALNVGYALGVDNGGEGEEYIGVNPVKIREHTFAADTARLYFYTAEQLQAIKNKTDNRATGWVFFVFGNDGWDVLSDYTTNLEELLKPANDLADSLQ